MPGLVRPRHVSRLVLYPHVQPQALAQSVLPAERRHAEAVAVHSRDRDVELADQVHVGGVAQPAPARQVPGVEQLAVADERVGVVVAGELDAERVELRGHDVVGVAAPAPGTPEGVPHFLGRRRDPAAPGADQLGRPGGGRHVTPVRALNSAIMASNAGSSSRRPRQKDWSRRTVKSASETPRCSTQVKYPRLKMRVRSTGPSGST